MIVEYGHDPLGRFWANQRDKGVDRRPRTGATMTDTLRDVVQDAVDAEAVCACGHGERTHKHLEECRAEDCWCPVYRPQEDEG